MSGAIARIGDPAALFEAHMADLHATFDGDARQMILAATTMLISLVMAAVKYRPEDAIETLESIVAQASAMLDSPGQGGFVEVH